MPWHDLVECSTGEVVKDYSEYLNTTHWLDLRKRVYKKYGMKCHSCGATKRLQVHHLTYANIGNEYIEDLIPLCSGCHMECHNIDNKQGRQRSKKQVRKRIKKTNNAKKILSSKRWLDDNFETALKLYKKYGYSGWTDEYSKSKRKLIKQSVRWKTFKTEHPEFFKYL